jgi:hypothetical protein
MKLQDCAEQLAWEIAFWLDSFEDPDYPLDQLGKLVEEMGEKLRALGIVLLLTNADSDAFYYNLIRSGRARRAYLQRIHDDGAMDDHHFASGRYQPFLDAVAANEKELAEEIVRLSPSDWRQSAEYEDDFCYAQLLHRLLEASSGADEVEALFEKFEAHLDGEDDARLNICRALATSDQEDFDDAFQALIEAREVQIAEDQERGKLEEPKTVAQRHVFVEGLAILRLAESRGISTTREYPLCPSLARVAMQVPFSDE